MRRRHDFERGISPEAVSSTSGLVRQIRKAWGKFLPMWVRRCRRERGRLRRRLGLGATGIVIDTDPVHNQASGEAPTHLLPKELPHSELTAEVWRVKSVVRPNFLTPE